MALLQFQKNCVVVDDGKCVVLVFVPQSSVLVPLLFTGHIADVLSILVNEIVGQAAESTRNREAVTSPFGLISREFMNGGWLVEQMLMLTRQRRCPVLRFRQWLLNFQFLV